MSEIANQPAAPAKKLEPSPAKKPRAAKSRGPWLNWGITLLVLGGGIWAGLHYWGRSSNVPTEFKTSPVTRGDVVQTVTANGSLNPVQLVEVGSQISGVITSLKADFNSKV